MNLHRINGNIRLFLNIFLSFFVKGGSVIVGVLTIPAYMAYFSNETVLGIWYTLLSLLTWVLNFDLGIGNGMRNMLVSAFVEKDERKVRTLVSSAYFSIAVVSLLFAAIGYALLSQLNLNSVMKISESLIRPSILRQAFLIVLIGIIGQFFLKLIVSILNAQEKTAISSMLPLLSNVIVLCFVAFNMSGNDEEKLVRLSWMYTVAVNVPYIVTTVIVFGKSLRECIPSIKYFSIRIAKGVLSLGGAFFAIQIALMVVTVTNEILITQFYGADKVVEYQVYNKVFYTVVTLFSLITNPVWSAITTAYCERRKKWIARTYRYLLLAAAIASVGLVIMAVILQPLVNIWLGSKAITIDSTICISFVIFSAVLMFCYAESSIANGMSKLRTQMVCYIFAAVVKIPLCFLAYHLTHRWDSIVLANGLCLLPYIFIQHFVILRDIAKIDVNQ